MRARSLIAASVACLALVASPTLASASGPTIVALQLPGATAFAILGYSCGGIHQEDIATGFDATTGFPVVDAYLETSCSAGGKGGHSVTYTAWAQGVFDFTGALVSDARLSGAPSVDPAATPTDAHGNQLSTSVGAINVLPANCTVTNTTYCTYSAWLTWGTGFVPAPRVTGISLGVGPSVGGATFTVTGTGFSSADAVSFGAVPARSFSVTNDTSITVTTPALTPGAFDVTVHSPGGTSAKSGADQYTAVAIPRVTSITPRAGLQSGGYSVTLHGANLTRVSAVDFGGTPTGFSVLSDTTLSVYVPSTDSYGPVAVSVVSPGGTSPVTSADSFVYAPTSCTSLNPCEASATCAKLTGSFKAKMTVSSCSPRSRGAASAVFSIAGTFRWSTSTKTTLAYLTSSSPGRGVCATGHVEENLFGAVVGGTSGYTAFGDPVFATLCVSTATHAVSLARGTTFGL